MHTFIEKLEQLLAWGSPQKEIILLALSAPALLLSLFPVLPLPFDSAWIAIVLCGVPILLGACIGLVTAFDIKADVLVSLALIASIAIGEIFAAGEVAFIMQLGALLENLTVAKARAGIEKLVQLTPQTARVMRQGSEQILPAEQVHISDQLRVLPGETIPVDGVITAGQTTINQAVLTGEPLPIDKTIGDEVFSGTLNQFGAFEMRATKVGEDSSIQRMIRLVQSADASKAKIVRMADRWATWIVVLALLSALGAWLITGQVIRAVTVLVVFCPCALILATPTAIMAAIGNASQHGFLVREGDALERLAEISKIAFDKTGTLTYGTPQVIQVKSLLPEYPEAKLYTLTASAEQFSEHPLGKAIVRCYQQDTKKELLPIEHFQMIPGQGVGCQIQGQTILAGNHKMLQAHSIPLSPKALEACQQQTAQGHTLIYVSLDGQLAGWISLADTLRPESISMIQQLKKLKLTPVLLTGDQRNTAQAKAQPLQIREVHAECLPEDKLNYLATCQQHNQKVGMVGDGINDAPALKKAAVSIAMGGMGSDIAIDAADIVLVHDEIKELPHLVALAKRMMTTIQWNLTFSMALNFAAIALAFTGKLTPITGALVHNAGSVLVIIHSAFLLKWRKKA